MVNHLISDAMADAFDITIRPEPIDVAALVTQVATPLGRACAETQLKNFGIAFPKDATPEELVKKLESLMGEPEKP